MPQIAINMHRITAVIVISHAEKNHSYVGNKLTDSINPAALYIYHLPTLTQCPTHISAQLNALSCQSIASILSSGIYMNRRGKTAERGCWLITAQDEVYLGEAVANHKKNLNFNIVSLVFTISMANINISASILIFVYHVYLRISEIRDCLVFSFSFKFQVYNILVARFLFRKKSSFFHWVVGTL